VALRSVSGPRAGSVTGDVGYDTTRLRYRDDVDAWGALGRIDHREGARGERWAMREGVRIGAYRDGLAYVEGRVAAIVHGRDDHRLCSRDELETAAERGAELLAEAGVLVDVDASTARVGRCDLAAELLFGDGRDGLALLRAAAHVDLPWLKAGTEGERRTGLETVYWRNVRGRSIQLRLYDKGRETGSDEPGRWLRLERQHRARKARERTVAEFAPLDHAQLFTGRELVAIAAAAEQVRVDRPRAISELRQLHDRGTIDARTLERLAGFVATEGHGLSRATRYRRWSELRSHGVELDLHDGDGAEVVPIGAYVRELGERWAA
jgi:hypothetical protein